MRIVLALAALLPVFVAGCGDRSGNGQNQAAQNAAGLPTPGPRPAPNPVAGSSGDQAFRQSFRDVGIATCVSSAQSRAAQGGGPPPGTDFRPACTCYIDRVMAGLNADQLAQLRPGPREQAIIQQCGREHGLIPGDGGGGK
ncbi:MAG TPA: hypothetical protein VMG08_21810 [Allosphingosinicella sp.]|nr:hypothetical protein [Allosphingosinicella sp.]